MKHSFFLLCLLLLQVFLSKAQITITQNDMPSAPLFGQGDTLRYSTASATNTNIDVSQTGANHTWDFSTLLPSGQGINEYKNSASTLYSFLGAGFNAIGLKQADVNLTLVQLSDAYEFYNKSSSVWEAKATGYSVSGVPLGSTYSNTDKIYQFPLNYNNIDSDDFHYTLSITNVPGITLSITYVRQGNRVNEVDGYGSITTPFGTFQCVRVKSTITETDSIDLGFGFPVPFPNNRIEYKWLANGINIPVLEVDGTELGGTFTPTSIKYRDIYRNLSPVADFIASDANPYRWIPVNFTNQSTSGSTANMQYKWTITPDSLFNYTNNTTKNSMNPVVIFNFDTTFSIQLKATNSSGVDSIIKVDYIKVKHQLLDLKKVSEYKLSIFPNPVHQQLMVSGIENIGVVKQVYILTVDGRIAQKLDILNRMNSTLLLDVSTLQNGNYFLQILTTDNVFNTKFVKIY